VVVSRAVVLGGGGPTAFAWQWGVVARLLAGGVALGDADLIVGTSSGSVAAAHLLDGQPRELLASILATTEAPDSDVTTDDGPFVAVVRRLATSGADAAVVRAEFCAAALAAAGRSEERLRGSTARYLPRPEWPRQRLLVPAIDAETGELTVFSRESGVSIVDAVAAACAVPAVWSPITIGARRYLDAIVRSPVNADLAAGYNRVVVVAPIPELRGLPGASLDEQIAPVRAAGEVVVVAPDATSRAAIGRDQSDFSRRPDAARAGMVQADATLATVTELWHS
jgi:NTE family protein